MIFDRANYLYFLISQLFSALFFILFIIFMIQIIYRLTYKVPNNQSRLGMFFSLANVKHVFQVFGMIASLIMTITHLDYFAVFGLYMKFVPIILQGVSLRIVFVAYCVCIFIAMNTELKAKFAPKKSFWSPKNFLLQTCIFDISCFIAALVLIYWLNQIKYYLIALLAEILTHSFIASLLIFSFLRISKHVLEFPNLSKKEIVSRQKSLISQKYFVFFTNLLVLIQIIIHIQESININPQIFFPNPQIFNSWEVIIEHSCEILCLIVMLQFSQQKMRCGSNNIEKSLQTTTNHVSTNKEQIQKSSNRLTIKENDKNSNLKISHIPSEQLLPSVTKSEIIMTSTIAPSNKGDIELQQTQQLEYLRVESQKLN